MRHEPRQKENATSVTRKSVALLFKKEEVFREIQNTDNAVGRKDNRAIIKHTTKNNE